MEHFPNFSFGKPANQQPRPKGRGIKPSPRMNNFDHIYTKYAKKSKYREKKLKMIINVNT